MATEPHFHNDEEREISRGGKSSTIWTIGIAVAVVAGGIALAVAVRSHAPPPERPGTTSATTTAGNEKPPGP